MGMRDLPDGHVAMSEPRGPLALTAEGTISGNSPALLKLPELTTCCGAHLYNSG